MGILERDDPIPVRTVCDSADAVLGALNSLPERGEAVVIERDGKPIGALIPMEDLALYQRLFFDREMEMDLAAVDRVKAEGGTPIPIEQLMKEFGMSEPA